MRWLMIALLVSLGALLFAAAGVARHIRLHRGGHLDEPQAGPLDALGAPKETNLESKL
jgi:hypothetical protein